MSFFNNKQGVDDKALSNQIGIQQQISDEDTQQTTMYFLQNADKIRTRQILSVQGFYSADDYTYGKYRVLSVTGNETWTDVKDSSNNTIFQVSSNAEIRAVNATKKLKIMPKNGEISIKLFGAKGDGITDDSGVIGVTLSVMPDNTTLRVPANNFYIASKLKFKTGQNNLKVVGAKGATFLSGLGTNTTNNVADTFTILSDNPSKLVNAIPVTADLVQYATTVTVAGGLTAAGVKAGDIAYIATTKTVSTGIYLGSLKTISAVTDTQITLEDGIDTALSIATDGVTLSIYRPMSNIHIEGVTFQLQNNNKQLGLYIGYVNNLIVKDCNFIGGGQSYIGIFAQGFNIKIDGVTCTEFRDDSLKLGYGVQVAGHDIVVTRGTFYRCKHAVTGGNNNFISKNLLYTHNYTTDPQLAGFDAHSSCQHVKMLHNRVVELGRSYQNASGFFARGRHFDISQNTVIGWTGAIGSTAAIYISEDAVLDVSMKGNLAVDVAYGVKADTLAGGSDYDISDNRIYTASGGTAIRLNRMSNCNISKNKIEAGASGIDITGGSNVLFEGNNVKYAMNAWGVGIYIDQDTSQTWTNIKALGNQITPGSSNASAGIRVKPNYDILNLSNNNIDTSTYAVIPVLLSENTALTKLVREKNIGETYYTSLPSATQWDRNRTIIVQGAIGVAEVDTLNITAGATATGNITITLNGVGTAVAVAAGDTASAIGDKIRATTFAGWTVGGTAGSSTVTFTKTTTGAVSAPAFADTGTTGTVGTFTRTTTGVTATNDISYICMKSNTDTYSWKQVIAG